MFIEIDEMNSVMYDYQLGAIIENDETIALRGIKAGVAKVKSYLTANNQKRFKDGRLTYDVEMIFDARGEDRDDLIVRICLTIAAWYICELSNIDIIYEHVTDRYEKEIDFLSMVAGVGKYENSPTVALDLPTKQDNPDDDTRKPFRYGSRAKFNYE
ncbi:hypothetical protein [Dysgonomonas sp. ZJ279]|uniref:hypothetical protein n=1 Tax=Dysgonomonas sp. ZJ279 TaxID=2709796 RepID=UPI0013ED9F1E|nr:hypothetical protein [Dysgonomonas sp. ZJ279]